MIRLFDQHVIRKQREIDGTWEFVKEDGKKYLLSVPGCWEQHPDMKNFRGKGTYIKKITLQKKTNLRLEFKGVSHTADVYFDDLFVVHHYNAFTPFAGIVRQVEAGVHTIRVEVDNTFGEHSALHTPNDYYTYGGLIRSVVVEEIPDVFMEKVHFLPYKADDIWRAKISVEIKNIGAHMQAVTVGGELVLTGEEADSRRIEAKCCRAENETTLVQWDMPFENVREWCPQNPHLYLLHMKLLCNEEVVDDYTERVGFRTIEVADRKLYLNGKKIFLKGFNRHEDYGVIGCAIPPQLMAQDLDMIQDMGANAIRTCHYPNDERFLDLCDERGIMIWEENHARGFVLEDMQNPNFEKQCADCNEEMVENHFNHPSIIIWGILNECASETEEGREMYRKQFEQIRKMDASRPMTFATCRHFTDICLDLPDIVSYNTYPGWYLNLSIKDRHHQMMEWIENAGGADKPVLIGEFGAAAIYGFRDRGRCKWSEERQEDIIKENLEVFWEDDRLSGVFIWQFADCRVTEEGDWFTTRARCHNNKGILDEYRRPKQAYDMIKEFFQTR